VTKSHAQIVISSGNVLLLNTDFLFNLGTGFSDVRWAGSGGFAAGGADRYVRLNNSTAAINWNAPNFVGPNNTLFLGRADSAFTVIWDKALNINVPIARLRVTKGTPSRDARASALINQPIAAASANNKLWIEGTGRVDLNKNSPNFKGAIVINGAEFRLNQAGRLSAVSNIKVGGGGQLTFDHMGTYNTPVIKAGGFKGNQVNLNAPVYVSGGEIRLRYDYYKYGSTSLPNFIIEKGSNQYRVDYSWSSGQGGIKILSGFVFPSGPVKSTLDVVDWPNAVGDNQLFSRTMTTNLFQSSLTMDGDFWVGKTLWAWELGQGYGAKLGRMAHSTYAPSAWTNARIPHIGSNLTIPEATPRNVLALTIQAGTQSLINSDTLTIHSGGILKRMGADPATFKTLKEIKTPAGVNLVVHNHSDGALTLEGKLNIGGGGLVKAGKGALILKGASAYVGTANTITGLSYLNEGPVYLDYDGLLSGAVAISGRILVGFGAAAPGQLIVARNEQIADTATVVLDGVATSDGGLSRHIPVFQIGNALRVVEHIHALRIEGNGIVRFSGAAGRATNQLFLKDLQIPTIPNANGSLFVQNWVENVTYLIVSRTAPNVMAVLNRIRFQGWAPGAKLWDYDANNWQIVPMGAPEPATYGAILGALGLGLVVWRKRRQRRAS